MTSVTLREDPQIQHKRCVRCVLDTTVPDIRFDADGVCQYCHIHDELEDVYPLETGPARLEELVQRMKRDGRGRSYDVVIGVSGGRDSTYALYKARQLGLRILAVHFDNGWNSEIAVTNIRNATERLKIDLETYVVDWQEFHDLQIAFLKASVSDAEVPTDMAIHAVLHRTAAREGVKYAVFAHSFRTEGVAPLGWTYMDHRYINDVHRRYGTRPMKTYPTLSLSELFYYRFVKGINIVPLLTYVPYDQDEVTRLLTETLGWTYYGGHHHESYYTKFFQAYYLPRKFGIDKRKNEYSALIRSGQMDRETALKTIGESEYPFDPELVQYVVSKLGLSRDEFSSIMAAPNKSFQDYKSYYPWIRRLSGPIRMASRLNLFPRHLFLKFLA